MCHNTMNHKILQSARRRNLNLSSVENELLKKKKELCRAWTTTSSIRACVEFPVGGLWTHKYTSTGGLTQFSAAQTHLELRCCSLQERRPELK